VWCVAAAAGRRYDGWFVNFFVFDPSPVIHLNGSTGNAVTYLNGNIVQA
jgi:hypothetical protein